jgi:hypothetical protein
MRCGADKARARETRRTAWGEPESSTDAVRERSTRMVAAASLNQGVGLSSAVGRAGGPGSHQTKRPAGLCPGGAEWSLIGGGFQGTWSADGRSGSFLPSHRADGCYQKCGPIIVWNDNGAGHPWTARHRSRSGLSRKSAWGMILHGRLWRVLGEPRMRKGIFGKEK